MGEKRTANIYAPANSSNEKRKAENAARMRNNRLRSGVTAAKTNFRTMPTSSEYYTFEEFKKAYAKRILADYNEAYAIEDEKGRCCVDSKHVYDSFFAPKVKNRLTKHLEKGRLSPLHLLMIDYSHLDIIDDVKTYSVLPKYLPTRDENGNYAERWLYFRTLQDEPEIQDGPEGPVSKRFYKSFWQGVTIRICGDGKCKVLQAPRGHLKSTLGASEIAFRLARDPSERHAIRCNRSELAQQFLAMLKQPFETNDHFQKLYGHLKPQNKEASWNTDRIQFKLVDGAQRGFDPTVQTAGMATDMTGLHYDFGACDDVVSEKNSMTPELLLKAGAIVAAMQAQLDPGGNFDLRGTKWEDGDAFEPYTGEPGLNERSGTMADDTCFFVATVLDGDETVVVSPLSDGRVVTPLGYGKPFFFDMETVRKKRRGSHNDRFYLCQYFNQTIGTNNRTFKRDWIRRIPEELRELTPREIAIKLKLDVFMGGDSASGKKKQVGKLDRTAALVLGQTKCRNYFYVLDGFREKLPAEQIPLAFVDMARKWQAITSEYQGQFKVGFEETGYTNFLEIAIREEQKKHGALALFNVEPLKHKNEVKADRIGLMAGGYCSGAFLWPEKLMVEAVRLTDDQIARNQYKPEPYDLMLALESEFTAFSPASTVDDLMDAHFYAWLLSNPTFWNELAKVEAVNVIQPGQYSRVRALEEDSTMVGVEYESPTMGLHL